MINTAKLLFSKNTDTDIINLKPKASKSASGNEFSAVFNRSLDKTSVNTRGVNSSRNDNSKSQKSEPKEKYNSFKDVKAAQNNSFNNKTVDSASTENTSKNVELTENTEVNSKEYNEEINVLAQMLGIQPNELVKLANELGLNLEDVNNIPLFVDKLTNVLSLNDSQKAMLNTLTQEVSKQTNTEAGSKVESEGESLGVLQFVQSEAADDKPFVSAIAAQVKSKLDQLIQNVQVNTEALSSDISKIIEAMRAQLKTGTQQVTDNNLNNTAEVIPDTEQITEQEKYTQVKEPTDTNNSKKENSSKESGANAADAVKKAAVSANSSENSSANTVDDQNQKVNQQTFNEIKLNMLNNQTEIKKTVAAMPQPVKSSEVLNQVMEQAKVVLGQDKSEMVIQLKPDHLGKLELKVVTEQGIVAAKFIAENQQVKEIIETNMQLLKDSLHKQGISIENVSVQVGNGKQNDQNQYNSKAANSGRRIKSAGSSNEAGMVQVGLNAVEVLPERLKQYSQEENTINLKA